MNHYLFKYSIESIKEIFVGRSIFSVNPISTYEFALNFQNINDAIYVNLSNQNGFIFPADINLKTDLISDVPFFQFIKRKLSHLEMVSIKQTGAERVCYIMFEESRGSIKKYYNLILEIIDRRNNAILTDENWNILQAYKYTNDVTPHLKYKPITSKMPDIFTDDIDKLKNCFKHGENILGINGFLKKHITNEASFIAFVNSARSTFESKRFKLYMYENRYVYPFFIDMDTDIRQIKEREIVEHFILKPKELMFKNEKRHAESVISRRILQLKKRMIKIKNDIKKTENVDHYRILAENLLANPNIETKYKRSITLNDIYTGERIDIVVNPKKDIFGNAEDYFKRYKKLKRGAKIIRSRLVETTNELMFLNQLNFDLNNASNTVELEQIKEIMMDNGLIRYNKKRKRVHYQPYEYRNIDGFDVYIGKNAKGNDYLVTKLASKNDLWFHPRNRPGAHLILKNPNRLKNIDNDVKMKCALAVAESTGNLCQEKIDVDYTFVKYVKKPKDFKTGMVTYSNFKTITVDKNECN